MCDKQAFQPAPTDKLYLVHQNGRIKIGKEYDGLSFITRQCTDGIAITVIPYEQLQEGRPSRVHDGTIYIGVQFAGQCFSRHPSDDGTITLLNRSKKKNPDNEIKE